MNAAPPDTGEARRLELLRELELAAVHGVPELDAVVRLAATVTQAPMATLCVVEQTQLHFVARHGLSLDCAPRAASLCDEVIRHETHMQLFDARLDRRFTADLLVAGETQARGFVGVALRVQGLAVACLGVIDRRCRSFDAGQLDALGDLALLVSRWLAQCQRKRNAAHPRPRADTLLMQLGEVVGPQFELLCGHSQILLLESKTRLAPASLQHLENAMRGAHRAGKLFDDLRRLARAASARAEEAQPLDLNVITRHALALRAETAQHAGVTLRHQAAAMPVHASADLGATMQIVAELLSNALHHTRRDGTLTLTVGVQHGHACIAVADEGAGLDAGQLRRLFDPLNQADSGRPLAGEHFGLGLVIARLLAMAVGGDVRAESVPDQGSVFTLELPLHVASTPSVQRQATTRYQ